MRVADAASNGSFQQLSPSIRPTSGILQPLQEILLPLYGGRSDFLPWLHAFCAQVDALKTSNGIRSLEPLWFTQPDAVGYCAYTDRFAGTLQGVHARIPHLRALGVRYLHLLPFLKARSGENDGGFAIASFDEIEPALGDMDDLQSLARALADHGIGLCGDLVLNHVADEHPWAVAARAGDATYRDFFHTFPDRNLPDAYEKTVAQVFPETAPGNFTWNEALRAWVWTTFYPYQWDLNYANPKVFGEMALAMVRLARRGIRIFRIDSAPFIWKALGTSCLNHPNAHVLLQAFRCVIDWAVPGTVLKSEAIVPAAQSAAYLGDATRGKAECHMGYHSALMAASWMALATQRTEMLYAVESATPTHGHENAWLTYVRCHDDIVWNVLRPQTAAWGAFDDVMRPIADFFAGRTAASFARGASFQASDDSRVHGTNGTTASLAGFSMPAAQRDVNASHARMRLLYALAYSFGGIPLIYMGDEFAQPNSTDHCGSLDGRQLQRPRWRDGVNDVDSESATQFFAALARARASNLDFASTSAREAISLASVDGADSVFAFWRGARSTLCLFNFGAQSVALSARSFGSDIDELHDLMSQKTARLETLSLEPWAFRWLRKT
jgi:amylosucrase